MGKGSKFDEEDSNENEEEVVEDAASELSSIGAKVVARLTRGLENTGCAACRGC
jgi:hypothetical protein